MSNAPWWRHAVCYQIYVRSFADSDGDGVGDLAGITARLPYVADLGVDAIWLTPFYRSPQADHGYDVADYRDVDPLFGDLAAFDDLAARAHELGLRLLVDIVPNHSSDQHAWFRAALAAGPGSPQRARYVFRPGRGPDGAEPPNNWPSVFGGSAWTRVPDGEWYLHLFDPGQPDFDWTHPDVGDEFEQVLRFWLDRGADGFRIDVANGLAKADGLPDLTPEQLAAESGDVAEMLRDADRPYTDQPAVHEVYRRWRRVLDDYPGDRMAIGEAWVGDADALARYARPDELQQVFNFHWLLAPWSAPAWRDVVERTYAATAPVGASPTWVLSNHDVVRAPTRYGGGEIGLARARSALLAMLALPGSAYLYQGEELGLPQADVAPDDRRDPVWLRGRGVGRDGCRVPVPWTTTGSTLGFAPEGARPWLPQPDGWATLSAEAQQGDPGSTLELVRSLLRLRRDLLPSLGDEVEVGVEGEGDVDVGVGVGVAGQGAVVLRRRGLDGPGLACVVAAGTAPVPLGPLGLDVSAVLVESAPGAVATDVPGGAVRPDHAAWVRMG